jgi:hypothetical protein
MDPNPNFNFNICSFLPRAASIGSIGLNMELDLQSLFKLHVYSCTYWLKPRNTLSLHLGS